MKYNPVQPDAVGHLDAVRTFENFEELSAFAFRTGATIITAIPAFGELEDLPCTGVVDPGELPPGPWIPPINPDWPHAASSPRRNGSGPLPAPVSSTPVEPSINPQDVVSFPLWEDGPQDFGRVVEVMQGAGMVYVQTADHKIHAVALGKIRKVDVK